MEYKRILTVQDVSCLGQCSAAIALPVLSACGHEACLLPTALLSTHTGGLGKPEIVQLVDFMSGTCCHWREQGISFDAIYTGYLGSAEAVKTVMNEVYPLLAEEGLLIVDPVMADNGKMYSGLGEEYVAAMKKLCSRADILLPNITEAAILTGTEYVENGSMEYAENLIDLLTAHRVVLTGVGCGNGQIGVMVREGDRVHRFLHPVVEGRYSGTGDLFASCFTGAMMQGLDVYEAAELGAQITWISVKNTFENPAHRYGVKFETALPELIRRLDR